MAKRRSAAEWKQIVAEWEASGLARGVFALQRGLNPVTLGWWRWKLRTEATSKRPEQRPVSDAPSFLEVVIDSDGPTGPDFVLELGEVRLRVPCGFDATELRRLVATLC